MSNWRFLFIRTAAVAVIVWSQHTLASTVIEDQGISMSREELEQTVKRWPREMQRAAADDHGNRLEMLNQAMTNKKIALEARKLSVETDPEAYWDYFFMIQRAQTKFIFDRYMDQLDVPDMSALAEERYQTERDKYARVDEQRLGSHILFACPPGCPRDQVRPRAEEVMLKLNQGEKFEDMVAQYSQDEATKKKGGRFTFWMERGEPRLSPPFLAGLFEIEEIGGYSTIVETEFGFHIIRLDEIQEAYYRPFEEVKDEIIASLEGEYRELAAKEFKARFLLTDEVRIDGEAMEEIFAPYKTEAAQ
jgi:parvulin-like peptidyl-prolyl isomerase